MQQVYKISLYPSLEALSDNLPMSAVWVEEKSVIGVQTYAEKIGLLTTAEHVAGFVDIVTAMECVAKEAQRVFPAQTEEVS